MPTSDDDLLIGEGAGKPQPLGEAGANGEIVAQRADCPTRFNSAASRSGTSFQGRATKD